MSIRVFAILIISTVGVEMNRCSFINYDGQDRRVIIAKKLHHNKDCYTQGLFREGDIMYESCGLYGKSKLYKYKIIEDEVERYKFKELLNTSFRNEYFAEGIAMVNKTIYMLTWKEHKLFKIDPTNFTTMKQYNYIIHGWGACNYHDRMFVTDGSDLIREISIDNENVHILKETKVIRGNSIVNYLNEMESINNELWVNIYQQDKILIIDRETGNVNGELWCNVKRTGNEEAMNGIAVLPNGNIVLTGKLWDSMFEIQIEYD